MESRESWRVAGTAAAECLLAVVQALLYTVWSNMTSIVICKVQEEARHSPLATVSDCSCPKC